MEGQPGYEKGWEVASTAKGIRPATEAEVLKWLTGHESDAVFAGAFQVGGRTMKVVKNSGGFGLE
jgi:hypothetical protein